MLYELNLILTITLHALVDEAIQQRATVVTKGGAPIGVDLEFMLCSGVLQEPKEKKRIKNPEIIKYNKLES